MTEKDEGGGRAERFGRLGAHRGNPVGGGEHLEQAAVVLVGDGAAGDPAAERNDPAAGGLGVLVDAALAEHLLDRGRFEPGVDQSAAFRREGGTEEIDGAARGVKGDRGVAGRGPTKGWTRARVELLDGFAAEAFDLREGLAGAHAVDFPRSRAGVARVGGGEREVVGLAVTGREREQPRQAEAPRDEAGRGPRWVGGGRWGHVTEAVQRRASIVKNAPAKSTVPRQASGGGANRSRASVPKANTLCAAEFMAAGWGRRKGESRRNAKAALGGGGGKAVRLGQEMRSDAE